MVLTADAGNTNIKIAIFQNNDLVKMFRLPTSSKNSTCDISLQLLDILNRCSINADAITSAAVSTVVPEATKDFTLAVRQRFSVEPLIVSKDTKTGILIKTDTPAELGADRLVNAAAAFYEYKCPLLVIDCGTATTYDVVTENGEFLGGIIAPGLGICAEALWEKTSRLPKVSIDKPPRVMGTDTVSSMKSGIYYGYIGQIEYLVRQLKAETGKDLKVIATGGLSGMFAGSTAAIDVYDPILTLKGLNYISGMNQ